MKYISLNWTLALKFSIGKKKRMRDCRILMAHDCTVAAHMLVTEFFSRAILVYFPLLDASIHFYVAFHRNIRE